jgi:hypothetical protein
MRQIVYVHVAGASERSTYRWVLSSTSRVAGTLSAYAGVDPAAPIVGAAGQANASSTSIVAPGVPAESAGEMLVGFFGIVADSSNAIAPPSGMTERVEVTPASGTPRPALELCDVALAAAGSSGTRTATATVPGMNVGQVVVLRAG